jgi:hypothetical protein
MGEVKQTQQPRQMTDREMLMLSFGALKAVGNKFDTCEEVIKIIENHIFPTEPVIVNIAQPPDLSGRTI